MVMQKEKNRSAELDSEIVRLNKILKSNDKKINKIGTLIDNSDFIKVLNNQSDTIAEEE